MTFFVMDFALAGTGIGASLFLLIVLSLLLYAFFVRPLFFAPLSHIPGPALCKLSWYYLTYYDLQLQRTDKIKQWHQIYGPILCIRPGEVSFSSSTLMREIYGTSGKYAKSDFFDHFMVGRERSIFSLKGYWEHQHKRSLMAGFWSKSSIMRGEVQEGIRERVGAFLGVVEGLVGEEKGEINVYPLNNCFAFDVVTRVVYGKRHGARTVEGGCGERGILLGLKQSQVWGPLKFNFPWICNWRFARGLLPETFTEGQTAEKDLEEWNLKRLKKALGDEEGEGEYTLLQRLRNVRDKEGKGLKSGYVAAETYDDVLAGQETTAVALTYVMWYLSRYPEWQLKIYEEVRSLEVEGDGLPSASDVDMAEVLDAFVREVLRMNPGSGGRQERVVPRGGKVYDGCYLPEGTLVSASPLSLHYSPLAFPSPHVFDPTRWLHVSPERLRVMEQHFIPFGHGARMCVGKALALAEMKMLLVGIYGMWETSVGEVMTERMMWQTGTTEAVPWGLRCVLSFKRRW